MREKYWQILLRKWREEGKNGFSIPFIIGSQQYLPPNNQVQNIKDLILDIVHNSTISIYITYCTDIKDLILGIRDNSKEKIAGYFPNYNSSPQSEFFVTNIADDLGKTVEENIISLTGKYQSCIDAKEFSKTQNKRGNYSPDERTFIESCYSEYFV